MKTIEYKVSFEKMVSRLPALFAYLESDDYGVVSLHKATDSLNGCWGKIVENINIPVSLTVDGNEILKSGETYSFRTIIDYYYQYRGELEEDDTFLVFIEKAIGKVEVEDFEGKTEATPKFLYLSNVKRLYNELVKMDKQCEFYETNLENGLTEKDKHLCCLCERYKQLGGDAFKEYVGGLIPKAEQIAEEYKSYAENAENEKKPLTLDFDIDLKSTYQDFGIMTPYAPTWLPYKRYKVGDNVEYNGELYKCRIENTGKWSDDYLTVVFDDTKFEKVNNGLKVLNEEGTAVSSLPYKVNGITDSKLVDLRRFVTYYNDDGIAERTEIGEDWLFYYRKNSVVNIRTLNDDLGNILSYSLPQDENGNKKPATSQTDLMAYGDVIEDITYDTENYKIKFTYRVGVHLNANESPTIVTDDDGKQLYKWKNFVWDNDTNIGIKYEEEYNYEEGSDLDKLINNTFTINDISQTFLFTDYIDGKYDKMIPNVKFEFITINNSFDYNKTIAHQDVNIVSILTDFEVYRNDFNEFAGYELFKEDYLNGITYKPTKNIDVHIERGSTSVFDKHIAFGEIKTMDDMVTYKNGSFFKMSVG